MTPTDIALQATDYALMSYAQHRDFGPCKGRIDIDDINQIIYITFKGTDRTWRDWFRNINPRSKGGAKLHAYVAAESVHRYLGAMMLMHKFEKYRVVVIGHSQGAAEAGQFYREYCKMGDDWCFMFAPPPFFKGWVELGSRAFVIINGRDVVSKLGWILFNLPRCNLWYFNVAGKLFTDLTHKMIRKCAREQKGGIGKLTAEHAMKEYHYKMHSNFKVLEVV